LPTGGAHGTLRAGGSDQVQGGEMRIVIVGQQAFGKSVLDAFMARGD
jgi:hypothetical protein